MNNVHIDHFDSTMDLKKATYETVKARVLAAGRFSSFEASASASRAAIFDHLCNDPELVCTAVEYPWVKVEKASKAAVQNLD
jgi:hypothetical protein